jgi:hypothetical protein
MGLSHRFPGISPAEQARRLANFEITMLRNLLTTLLVLCCVSTHAADTGSSDQALAKARDYLWSQQREDGSWRSEQYAVMRSGQSLTPFVLHTLLNVPRKGAPKHADDIVRGLDFIRKNVDEDAAIGRTDPDVLEYPVYSTAYSLLCLSQVHDDQLLKFQAPILRHAKYGLLRPRMANFLSSAQFGEGNGFTSTNPAYGGWGFDIAKSPGDPGHMDLAHTRRALQAIVPFFQSMVPRRRPDLERAQRFLAVVQKRPETLDIQPIPEGAHRPKEIPFDGGFYFSPVVLQANKGRFDDDGNYWRSYATATCDGILALLAAGVPEDDERITAAVAWLKEHTNLDYSQGIPTDYPEPWGDALQFYHYAVRAEVYAALDFPADERRAFAENVAALQRPDGSFVNTASLLMKEDEPLLATALAVVALSHCLQ